MNNPSPAIATLGLEKIAEMSEKSYWSDVGKFIRRNFYFDDGLTVKKKYRSEAQDTGRNETIRQLKVTQVRIK